MCIPCSFHMLSISLHYISIYIYIYSVLFAVVGPDDYNICTMYIENSDIESISAARSASETDPLNAGPSSGTNHHHVLWRIQEADWCNHQLPLWLHGYGNLSNLQKPDNIETRSWEVLWVVASDPKIIKYHNFIPGRIGFSTFLPRFTIALWFSHDATQVALPTRRPDVGAGTEWGMASDETNHRQHRASNWLSLAELMGGWRTGPMSRYHCNDW